MWYKRIGLAALLAALAISSAQVQAQRSSPQFSFPQLSPQANQFSSSDMFASSGPQLTSFPSSPLSSSSGQAQSSFVQMNTGPQQQQQAPASLLDPSYPAGPSGQLVSQPSLAASPQASFNFQPEGPAAQPAAPLEQQPRVEPASRSSLLTVSRLAQQEQQSSLRQAIAQQLGFQAPQTSTQEIVRPAEPAPTRSQSSRRQPQQASLPLVSSSVSTSTSPPVSSSSASRAAQRPAASGLVSAPSSSSSSSSSSSTSQANQRAQQHNSQHLGNANVNQQVHSVESARRAEANSASATASSGQSYSCPDSFGFFRHHKSCDKYWACVNGTATLKVCGNGLNFDDSDPKRENCAYPFSVDCGSDRTDLEPPISTANCPRLYGLFSDTSNCRVFYSCWNGEASKYECPPGLAYDAEQRVCVWADLVDRCDQSEVSDGFVCPDATEADQPGLYTRHAHPTDCRKFYVCIDGTARPYGCSFGTVFNVDSLQCDEPESVSGCEKYYGDLDPKLAKKLARESQAGNVGSSSSSSSGAN